MNNMTTSAREVSIVLGDSPAALPIKEGQISNPEITLNFTKFEKINKAFAPMVRNLAFDVCEMAAVTFLQAIAAGKPLRLLPVVLVGKLHHGSLFYDPNNGSLKPEELKGRKVGVRAYTQTTGMWVRGILHEQYGVPLDEVTWVTTEEAHVAEYVNPSNVVMMKNANLVEMLRTNEVSAIIMGPSQSKGLGLQQLIPDVEAASTMWYEKHHTVPINHMVVVKEDFLKKDPEAVKAIYDMLCQGIEQSRTGNKGNSLSAVDFGLEKIWNGGALQLAMEYSLDQKLIPRLFDRDELFVNIPL
jgi:4,5-dihydroxyphthalate decarboxylase